MTEAAPTRTLVLVRHGETVGQSSIRYYGRSDIALSELGRSQMRAVASFLARERGLGDFSPVFASPLVRATEGARIITGDSTSMTLIDEFVEVDFGLFEGLTAEEIRARYPDEFARWQSNPLASEFTYPGGENRAEFQARVERGVARMEKLLDTGPPNSAALIVAHRGVLRAIARKLAGVQPTIDIGSIQILERAGDWAPSLLDFTEHLKTLA